MARIDTVNGTPLLALSLPNPTAFGKPGAEELDFDPVPFKSFAVIPPIGIGGVCNGRPFFAGKCNRNELAIRTIESGKCWILWKLREVSPMSICWRNRNLATVPWIGLIVP